MEKIIVNISWQDNYGAASDDVLGCVAVGDTLDEVKSEYTELLKFHLEGLEDDEIPVKVKGEYELIFQMDVHALLHHYEGILTRPALSKVTGINQRLLGHYATGLKTPRSKQREKIIEGIHKIGRDFLQVV